MGSARAATAQCGNGIVDTGEDCDDGGTCAGGANAGTHCQAESDCLGNGMCVGGTHARSVCSSADDCPGSACLHCVPQGGDGCAANCTFEYDLPYPLVPGSTEGASLCIGGSNAANVCCADDDCPGGGCAAFPILTSGTSGLGFGSPALGSLPYYLALPFDGFCNGGTNASQSCRTDADCPGSTCAQPQQILTLGKPRDGKIPLVIRADSQSFPAPGPNLSCICVRGVVAKTCGGTLFNADGVTPALDCTPGFTAGDSVCAAAGKPPCSFVHGAANSASGDIGCDGFDNLDVLFSQDSGGSSGVAGPPMVTRSGSGGPGAASVFMTTGVITIFGVCTGTRRTEDGSCADPGYGPDCLYCTADDPPGRGALSAVEATSPAVTGMATAVVHNSDGVDGQDFGPATITGAPFSCSALAGGSSAGAGLVQAFAFVHQDTVDGLFTMLSFARAPLPPTPTPLVPVSSCVGDCDGGGDVTVNEIITMVDTALSSETVNDALECPGIDQWCNGPALGVTVDCIIQAVNNALTACPAQPTPLATPTVTPNPSRFVDNNDGTITDPQTGLMWEKKSNDGSIHDWNNEYTLSTCADAPTCSPDGTAFTVFLKALNTPPCFAGYCDWRVPTVAGPTVAGPTGYPTGQAAELESILAARYPNCTTNPCVSAVFNNNCTPGCSVAHCSCTQPFAYWSSSTYVGCSGREAWFAGFGGGYLDHFGKSYAFHVRAVRGGV